MTEYSAGERRLLLDKDGTPAANFAPDKGRWSLCGPLVLVVAVLCAGALSSGVAATTPLVLAYFLPASDTGREGFARIINHSDAPGTVEIVGIDDAGVAHGPIELSLEARQTVHFNSRDLERGNPEKGVPALGDGEGAWLLSLTSELDVELLSYVRTEDGFVTAMSQEVPATGMRHHVGFFNPGSNESQVSRLRLVNPTGGEVEVTIEGRDDAGEPAPGGEVRLALAPGEARTLSAQVLESGGEGLDGALGDGAGKWQLLVSAEGDMHVMSLLASPTGHLSNLSAPGARRSPSCDVVHIPDSELRAAVEGALGKAAGAPVTRDEMAALERLDGSGRGIRLLTGLECAIGLTWLNLENNQLTGVTALSGLTNLGQLDLSANQLTDVRPLAGLSALWLLDLGHNPLTDVTPLSGLTTLRQLDLIATRLTDVTPLAGLTNLTWLSLTANRLTDVKALSGMTAMVILGVGNNQLTDVTPLSGLTAVTWLNLAANRLTDVTPLTGLTALTSLLLQQNQLSDIGPLVLNAGLDRGDELDLSHNPLNAVSTNTHIPALRLRGVRVTWP